MSIDDSAAGASTRTAGAANQPGRRRSTKDGWPGRLARELEELIAALDRRVPRVEEAGEAAIARDAAALRAKASNRLAELADEAGSEPGSGDPA